MPAIASEDVSGLRVIIDTNVFIAIESVGNEQNAHGPASASLLKLIHKFGIKLVLSSSTRRDVLRASDARRNQRLSQLTKYDVLKDIPRDDEVLASAGFPEVMSPNDEVDADILTALHSGAASWLITQDEKLRARSRRAGFSGYVFSIEEAIDTLGALLSRPVELISVQTRTGYEIDLRDPLFDSIKRDYPDFVDWWRKRVAGEPRDVLTLEESHRLEGIAVLKIEEDQPYNLGVRVLKLCTFKVSEAHGGSRRGERLLYATIEYARKNGCDVVYLEVLSKHQALISWLSDFGFRELVGISTARGEIIHVKYLAPHTTFVGTSLQYNVYFGPGALCGSDLYLIPIQGKWHAMLFPDAEPQLPMLEVNPCGNAIRKVYLCHANIRALRPGNLLLFVRSGKPSAARAVGVVEETVVSRDLASLIAFAGNRTVYTIDEMKALSERTDVLAIKFRLDRFLPGSWTKGYLIENHALEGRLQSIQRPKELKRQWLLNQIRASH